MTVAKDNLKNKQKSMQSVEKENIENVKENITK